MINEELSHKSVNLSIRASKATAKDILALLKWLVRQATSQNKSVAQVLDEKAGGAIPLKDLVKKGQLESIPLKEPDLKHLKKELNKHGIAFSIMKDKAKGDYQVFFQAKNTQVMDFAFRKAIQTSEKNADRKASTLKKIKEFKEKAGSILPQDKVKHKQKEQSL